VLLQVPCYRHTKESARVFGFAPGKSAYWGGDPLLMDKLFKNPDLPGPLNQQAGLRDGVMSILTGIAAHKSVASGKPVRIEGLSSLKPRSKRI